MSIIILPKLFYLYYNLIFYFCQIIFEKFIPQLKQRAFFPTLGKNILYIGQFEPSSQLCHVCGYKNPETKNLEVREWVCPNCGTTHNRDLNAAINIKQIALSEQNLKYENSGLGKSVELVESLTLVRAMKREQNILK